MGGSFRVVSSQNHQGSGENNMQIRDRIKSFRRVPAAELKPSPANWRTHPAEQADALRGILSEVGYADALLARELPDGTLELVDGHLRAETTPDMDVPVLVLDVTEDEAKKLLLTIDPLAAMANADRDRLDALLREVQTGNEALAGMMTELAEENGIIQQMAEECQEDDPPPIDRAGELQKKWRTERGQLWLIPSKTVAGKAHRLLCGDSTDAGDVGRVMGGERAGLMNTDPPYGVDYQGGRNPVSNRPRERLSGDGDASMYAACFAAATLPNSTPVYFWFADRAGEPVYKAVRKAGYKVRAIVLWNKLEAHYGNFMAQYMKKHEPCLYCVKEPPQWYGPTNEITVWDVKQPTVNEFHPTQKPVELFARPIRNHLQPGEIAYEPFAGSGSQFVAAEQLARLCYGIELEPKYVAVCLERLSLLGLSPELSP